VIIVIFCLLHGFAITFFKPATIVSGSKVEGILYFNAIVPAEGID
jgi:hypothetical protein